MRVLVTGINGFVGKHLARELYSRGVAVIGTGRDNQPHPELQSVIESYSKCDLTDEQDVARLPLDGVSSIINLAGLAKVGDSFGQTELYNRVNTEVLGVPGRRLVAEDRPIRLVAISTGAVYDSNQPLPLTEESLLIKEGSPYALSKISMEKTAEQLRKDGLNVVLIRPFNHIGPGQEPGFLLPDLSAKIQMALKNNQPVTVGNLKSRRDYTDVRDVVRAYADLALADQLEYTLYNVCSGKSTSGQEILDLLLRSLGAEEKVQIETSQELLRPGEPQELFGSNQRLNQQTGWQPRINLPQTIADFIKG